jgi:electron transfer flavoprotein alpha subunit
MPILILAEHHHTAISPATRAAVGAAQKLGGDIHLLIAGHNASDAAKEAATLQGVAKILHADAPHYAEPLAEALAALIAPLAPNYSHIIAPATTFGKDAMPRLAGLIDAQQISEITAIHSPTRFTRPIYAGNALETVEINASPILLTIRPTAFEKATSGGSATIETLSPGPAPQGVRFVSKQEAKSERPELASARIVISGGRGLGSKENFALIEKIADKLGAAIGASRAAVDAGYVPNDYQVGQTGKVVAPELYIAVGISGAIQHLAGMKDSKIIVAINKDENAPIFELADYGLVGDLFQILPELEKAL